jgi:hypothetical protein
VCFLRLRTGAVRLGLAAVVVSAADWFAAVASQGAAAGFVWVPVCHRCLGDLSQGTAAEAAGAAVAEVEADAEGVHCLAEGSVAVGAAANGREAARSAVAGHLVVAGSAEAVAVGLALGETKEAAGTIDRLAEAQNIAVAGLSCINVMLRDCQCKEAHHIRSSLGVLEHVSLC